MNPMHFFKF